MVVVAAAIALGAQGVQMGTVFLLNVHQPIKKLFWRQVIQRLRFTGRIAGAPVRYSQ